MADNSYTVVALDIETTGLDPVKDKILEAAAYLVPPHAVLPSTIVDDGVSWIVDHDYREWWVPQLPDRVAEMHTKNRLLAKASWHDWEPQPQINGHLALEGCLYEYLEAAAGGGLNSIVLLGHSVHFDRSFLLQHCPRIGVWLSHRHIDLSTMRILARQTNPEQFALWDKARPKCFQEPHQTHRAVPDVVNSVLEYQDLLAVLRGLRWV